MGKVKHYIFVYIFFCIPAYSTYALTGEQILEQSLVNGGSCSGCHEVEPDPAHALGCSTCHLGDSLAEDAESAHANLIVNPAHPSYMDKTCGRCHAQVDRTRHSLHFTLSNEINTVRTHFGARDTLETIEDIPVTKNPKEIIPLVDDMLRRRCLRCHVYYRGDRYAETVHGTGCAACHLEYGDGGMLSHRFVKSPPDRQCLHCHYGNHVGADFYGRFEHDYKEEFRTPYQPDGAYPPRPYGVEYHQLNPDVHQKAGMACIDCHSGSELMQPVKTSQKISCESCHLPSSSHVPPAAVERRNTGLQLTTILSGKTLDIPPATHPAHKAHGNKAACTVCHAQWSFSDRGVHLLRLDVEDYDTWEELIVQSSFEIEMVISNSLYGAGDIIEPIMRDKITGRFEPGMWLKGFIFRRWEDIPIAPDAAGKLQVMRPILDLHISYVNSYDEVVFDSFTPSTKNSGMLPYTPHTIGKAGALYHNRLVRPEKTEPTSTE